MFHIGKSYELSEESVGLPLMALGLAGSGKTIGVKALIEEAALLGIPSIQLDSQGDLTRMALPTLLKDYDSHMGTVLLDHYYQFHRSTTTRIYTPASCHGLPMSFSPIQEIPKSVTAEERTLAIDAVCHNLLSIMDYRPKTDDFKNARLLLYGIIDRLDRNDMPYPETPDDLIYLIGGEGKKPTTTESKLVRRLYDLGIGQNALLFSNRPLNVEDLLTSPDGKTPINVVYLNTLSTEQQLQFVVSSVTNAVYRWMITHPAESSKPRLILFIDEASKFFPPHPHNPPSKNPIKRLLKECRKYHVLVILASQNYSDLDYKGMAQAGVYMIGRLTNKNDFEYLRPIIESRGLDTQEKLAGIPRGTMFVLDSTKYTNGNNVKVRWLYTDHGTPIAANEIADMLTLGASRRNEILTVRAPVNAKIICLKCKTDVYYLKQYESTGTPYLCPCCRKWKSNLQVKKVNP